MSRCMESMLPYHTTTALALLTSMLSACPRTYGWTHEDENGYPYPVAFKVTKFVCGGFTIGMSTSRIASDGWGGSQFFQAELASGKSEPSVKLVCMRERLVGSITTQPMPSPMDEASAAVSPFLPATDVTRECFKVDGESIRRLKMSLVKERGTKTMEQTCCKQFGVSQHVNVMSTC